MKIVKPKFSHSIALTSDELLAIPQLAEIDRKEVQDALRLAQEHVRLREAEGLTDAQARFVAALREEAITKKLLVFRPTELRYCRYSGEQSRPALTKMGLPRADGRLIHASGIEFADRFVSLQGSVTVGCSVAFFQELRPRLAELLADIEAEIPEAVTGVPTRWKRYEDRRCKNCGWEGHDGELATTGGFWNDKECPTCFKRDAFSDTIEHLRTYTCVPTPS